VVVELERVGGAVPALAVEARDHAAAEIRLAVARELDRVAVLPVRAHGEVLHRQRRDVPGDLDRVAEVRDVAGGDGLVDDQIRDADVVRAFGRTVHVAVALLRALDEEAVGAEPLDPNAPRHHDLEAGVELAREVQIAQHRVFEVARQSIAADELPGPPRARVAADALLDPGTRAPAVARAQVLEIDALVAAVRIHEDEDPEAVPARQLAQRRGARAVEDRTRAREARDLEPVDRQVRAAVAAQARHRGVDAAPAESRRLRIPLRQPAIGEGRELHVAQADVAAAREDGRGDRRPLEVLGHDQLDVLERIAVAQHDRLLHQLALPPRTRLRGRPGRRTRGEGSSRARAVRPRERGRGTAGERQELAAIELAGTRGHRDAHEDTLPPCASGRRRAANPV